ncbi:CpaF family protein [Xanthobacter sp. TB0139]|uniref:CpaF family protein n=1 Tax=Xanthobacter sp. TB0139 TaxID=3459178 RepID=UPI0040394E05
MMAIFGKNLGKMAGRGTGRAAGTGFGPASQPGQEASASGGTAEHLAASSTPAAVRLPDEDDGFRQRAATIGQRWMERLMANADLIAVSRNASVVNDASQRTAVRAALAQIAANDPGNLSRIEREKLIEEITAEVVGYGPIEVLLADDSISEVMVNSASSIYLERGGRIEKTKLAFRSEETLLRICRKIVEAVGRTVDAQSPMCDARLKDGSRVNVIIPPVAVDGTCLTIRKFKKDRFVLADMVRLGSMTAETAELLHVIGRIRVNVVISGGTGSGKTTLLNCLTGVIDASERIITCEDTAELQLQQPHVVRLETRPASNEGTGEVTMRSLVRNALRMKPHRIIVGEVRDDAAIDLIQAMNTGHMGSMGTVHANDPRGCLARIEALIRTGSGYQNLPAHIIRKDLADSLDVVVQTQQLPSGRRVITHVTEVCGLEGETVVLQDLLRFNYRTERIEGTGIIKPLLSEQASRYGEVDRLTKALQAANGGRS